MLQKLRSGSAVLEKDIYGLVMARIEGSRVSEASYHRYIFDLAEKGIGGFVLSGGRQDEIAPFIRELQASAGYPLFIAADATRGLGSHLEGTTVFPSPMAFAAALGKESEKGLAIIRAGVTALIREALATGINMPLTPFLGGGKDSEDPAVALPGREYRTALEARGLVACRYLRGDSPLTSGESQTLTIIDEPAPSDAPRPSEADLIIARDDPGALVERIAKALEEEAEEETLLGALARTRAARSRLSPYQPPEVDYEANERLSRAIARMAVTLVKGKGTFLPLRDSDAIPLVFSGNDEYFRTSPLRFYVKQASHVRKALPPKERPVLFLLFPDRTDYRDGMDIGVEQEGEILRLLRAASPSWVVAFGDPRSLTRFKEADILIAAYDPSPEAQEAVFACVIGEESMTGSLPAGRGGDGHNS